MQLFYNPDITESDLAFTFDKNESRHIINVLRKKIGDELKITNGDGWLFKAIINDANSKKCSVNITTRELKEKRGYMLHLAVAPTKMNDRYEWFLEKATEIGVDSITPIFCGNSERTRVKPDRFSRVIESALKQSNQFFLPKLREPQSFEDFLNQNHAGEKYIAHCEDSDKTLLKDSLTPSTEITILIGPEGDFTEREINLAVKKGFKPVSLGLTRLRTETAAIVACHSVAFINES